MIDWMQVGDEGPGWRIERFEACWWLVMGKWVLRIGKPWGHRYRYAWRPLLSVFRCFK